MEIENHLAKCTTGICEKYKDCKRAKSHSKSDVSYKAYCLSEEDPSFQWFVEVPKTSIQEELNDREKHPESNS